MPQHAAFIMDFFFLNNTAEDTQMYKFYSAIGLYHISVNKRTLSHVPTHADIQSSHLALTLLGQYKWHKLSLCTPKHKGSWSWPEHSFIKTSVYTLLYWTYKIASGSGPTFIAPLMLLVALITFYLTKATYTVHTPWQCHAPTFAKCPSPKHVEKKWACRLFPLI